MNRVSFVGKSSYKYEKREDIHWVGSCVIGLEMEKSV